MILEVNYDAYYILEATVHTFAGGHFYLKNNNDKTLQNGVVPTLSTIIKHMLFSV